MANEVTYGTGSAPSIPSPPTPLTQPYGTPTLAPQSQLPGTSLPGAAAGGSPYAMATGTGVPPGVNQQTADQVSMANQLFNFYNVANAPAQQNINNQLGYLQQQADMLGANQSYQSGLLNTQQGIQLAGVGLNQQQQDIQRGALQRQVNLLPQQQQLQRQQYGIQGGQLGLQQQGIGLQQQQLGLQSQGQQQQLADLFYGNSRASQNLIASKAAQGATNTAGATLGQQDLAQQLQSGLANIQRAQAGTGIAGQQLGLNSQSLGLQQQGLGIQQQQSELGFKEQQAAQQDAMKNLDVMAQKTGLDKQEIENRTQQALNQLGLSSSLSTLDIYKAMSDAQAGRYNPVSSIFGSLYQLSGLNPFNVGQG